MRGRRFHIDPPIRFNISIASSVNRAVRENLPRNHLTGRHQHGSLSNLIEALLIQWLSDRGVDHNDYREDQADE